MVNKKRILIFGASGMLGSAMFDHFYQQQEFVVYGTCTDVSKVDHCMIFSKAMPNILELDVNNEDHVSSILESIKPDIIINCVGFIKQRSHSEKNDEIGANIKHIMTNAVFPWILVKLKEKSARLIHISTDCVFSGIKGNYNETDVCDCIDLYGRTKLIGEPIGDNVCVIRTSIIGHELNTSVSLLDWFLQSNQKVSGYVNAVFSGLPTIVLARMIAEYVIPYPSLNGLFNLSASPISKFELLDKVRRVYNKDVDLCRDSDLVIDRSLNSQKLRKTTGFKAPTWDEMLSELYIWGLNKKLHDF